MTAGDLSYFLGWTYDSDDNVPIAAANPTYYWGLPFGKVDFTHPVKVAEGKTYWAANSANPAGYIPKEIWLPGEVAMNGMIIDGVPFYLALGGVPTLAANVFTFRGSVTGAVPSVIWHRECNEILTERAKEYSVGKCTDLDLKLVDGDLAAALKFAVEREYNETSDSIVRQTNEPKLRGSVNTGTYKTPAEMLTYLKFPYPVHSNTKGHSIVWNAKTLPYLRDVKFSIKNAQVPRKYSASNWTTIQNKGKRTFSELVMTFCVKPAEANHLDDMEAYVDSSTLGNLVWKISRRHANDFIQMTFEDAYLKSWEVLPTPQGQDYDSLMVGTWAGITDLEVVDASKTAADVADPLAAADYEAVA
jgi:hypothetical protein